MARRLPLVQRECQQQRPHLQRHCHHQQQRHRYAEPYPDPAGQRSNRGRQLAFGCDFTSSAVSTRLYDSGSATGKNVDMFDVTDGYIEASLELPIHDGSLPAFWMLQGGWPAEIEARTAVGRRFLAAFGQLGRGAGVRRKRWRKTCNGFRRAVAIGCDLILDIVGGLLGKKGRAARRYYRRLISRRLFACRGFI